MRRHVLFSLLAAALSAPTVFAADAVADTDQGKAVEPVTTVAAADAQAVPPVTSRLILPSNPAAADAPAVTPAARATSQDARSARAQDAPIVRPLPPAIRKGFDARRPLLFGLYGMSAGLQAYDGYTTLTALRNYEGSYELNPAMRSIVQQPAKFLALKATTAAASIAISEMLWQRNHKVLSVASMLISNSIMATVAAHNTRVIAELDRR